jgi:hypothetical protein
MSLGRLPTTLEARRLEPPNHTFEDSSMKLTAYRLPAKLAAIGILSTAASSLLAQPGDCTPNDYKILSPTALAIHTQCAAETVSKVSGSSTIVSKKAPGQSFNASLGIDTNNKTWIYMNLVSGSLAGSTQYTVSFAGNETLKAFALDIDTSFIFSLGTKYVAAEGTSEFESHVAISAAGGTPSCEIPQLTALSPNEKNPNVKPTCRIAQDLSSFETVGLIKVTTGRMTRPAEIKTITGMKSAFGEDPKVDPKARLSPRKAPSSKDASSYYINFSDLAGTGTSPSWALDGKVSPAIGPLLGGFQIGPLFTASVGQGSIPSSTYSDTVSFGGQGVRNFYPQDSGVSKEDSWVLGLTPGLTYGTDKEFDRDSIVGVLDFGVNPPGSYNTVGRKMTEEFREKLTSATMAQRANLSIDDVDTPLFGYTYDLHVFTEDGADPIDSTVKASKGTASMTLPSYGIARVGVKLHSLLQVTDRKSPLLKFGMFSAEVTAQGRYLIATENTVLQRKDNSLYLERLSGWKGNAKLMVNWVPDQSGHAALTGTYTNGFDAPKYNRINSVLLGITMKY